MKSCYVIQGAHSSRRSEQTEPEGRGLTFEMILEAIDNGGLLDVLPDAAHPGQVVLAVRVAGYVHALPCEFRGEDLRMITAFPSRKLHKIYDQ